MRFIPHASSKNPKNPQIISTLLISIENSVELILKSESLSISLIFYKIIKLISELFHEEQLAIRDRFIKIAMKLWNSKKDDCIQIGCELIRILQQISRVEGISQIFSDLAKISENGKPIFWNMLCSTKKRINGNEYLNLSISPNQEKKLTQLMLKVDAGLMSKYAAQWILNDSFIGEGYEESQLILADWVRYIVVNFHVPKLLTPRWYLIGWLLSNTRHENARALLKQALFYDWLFLTAYFYMKVIYKGHLNLIQQLYLNRGFY